MVRKRWKMVENSTKQTSFKHTQNLFKTLKINPRTFPKTQWKHLENFFEIPSKFLCYALKFSLIIFETLLIHLWTLTETTLEICLTHFWNFLLNNFQVLLKYPFNFVKTSLKNRWNALETFFKQPWNKFETPLKFS